jgi:membrane protein
MLLSLAKESFRDWGEDKAERLGAALAYYAIFSIGPLLLIATAMAGFFLGEAAVRGELASRLKSQIGDSGAEVVSTIVQNASKPATGIIATVIGLVMLLLAASGLFGHLKDALNTIWEVAPAKGGGVIQMVFAQALQFIMVLVIGVLLLASLLVNSLLAALSDLLKSVLPGGALPWQILGFVVTIGMVILVFALIYKVLPDVVIQWRDVWIGATITAVLFVLGQLLLSLYLGLANPGTAFGAAGSLVVLLVWIYYSAQIVFFGAEVTQVYATEYGSGITPKKGAEFVTEEKRAQQGLGSSATGRKTKRERRKGATGSERLASPWFK